jgi:asparaginyl-tRNA synthetase
MRVRNAATMAIHNFFQKEGFINVHTPIISANDCEGAGELFMVSTRQKVEAVPGQTAVTAQQKDWNHFFNVPEAYLTVSGQLDAEIFACAMGRVYTFGPTFRAEKSNTPRHLAEFWMVEPEVAFLDLEGDMQLAERFIKSVVGEVSAACNDDISFFEKWVDPTVRARINATLNESFARVDYTDAVEILKKAGQVRIQILILPC